MTHDTRRTRQRTQVQQSRKGIVPRCYRHIVTAVTDVSKAHIGLHQHQHQHRHQQNKTQGRAEPSARITKTGLRQRRFCLLQLALSKSVKGEGKAERYGAVTLPADDCIVAFTSKISDARSNQRRSHGRPSASACRDILLQSRGLEAP